MPSAKPHLHWNSLLLLCFLALAPIASSEQPTAAPLTLETAESRSAPYAHGQVHYKTIGQGRPTIVLVHGWSCSLDFWNKIAPILARDNRVIALDLPGHGQNAAPEVPYTIEHFAEGLAAVLDHAHADKVVLAGHSMGYPVCRRVAQDQPERVLGLAIIDGALLTPPDEPAALPGWQQEMSGFVSQFAGNEAEANAYDFFRAMFGPRLTTEQQDFVLDAVDATPRHVRASAMEHFTDPAVWDVPPLPQPAAALYALSPELPPDFEGLLRALHPRLNYRTLGNAGHFFLLTHPEETARTIQSLLPDKP